MKIAILSDIHDHVWNLAQALQTMQPAQAVICCGDLCSPFIITQLAAAFPDRPVHIVFGNNDGDTFRMTRIAAKNAHVNIHGELFQAELAGLRFVANHFDNIAASLARSGSYDVVCFGHNHRFQVEQVGETLAINPGAIMGYDPVNARDIPATFVLFDTETRTPEKHTLAR
jgi:putative phosphoesterase